MQRIEKTPEFKSKEDSSKLVLMTFNIGCFPAAGFINLHFLRPNHQRVRLITDKIIAWNKKHDEKLPLPDVICFQEVWSKTIRLKLENKLSPFYLLKGVFSPREPTISEGV